MSYLRRTWRVGLSSDLVLGKVGLLQHVLEALAGASELASLLCGGVSERCSGASRLAEQCTSEN
jgi:hypothetical protein